MLAGLVSAAVAQTNAPATLAMSLQDCIAAALQHNFDVRVERYEPLKSQLSLDAAYAGYDPTLSLSGKHSYNHPGGLVTTTTGEPITEGSAVNAGLGGGLPWGTTYNLTATAAKTTSAGAQSGAGQIGINVTQPLLKNLWIDSTRLGISAAKSQLKVSEQGLRQQLITTVSAVENAFYELIFSRDNLNVQHEALNLAQTQLDQDRQRVLVGSLAPLDVQQDEAQVAQNRANVIAAQFSLATAENTLKNLVTDNYLKWHDVDIIPDATLDATRQWFDVQNSWSKGMVARPDLIQAKLNLEQQGIQLKYDRNQLFPQLDLVASYGYNGAGNNFSDVFGQYVTGDRPFYSAGGQFSMPLRNVQARSSYKSDQAIQQQEMLKLKQLEQNIMVQIDDAVKQAQSASESVDATKQARVYAEAALDAEQKKYAVGKSTTFTVLQLQINLTTARSQEIRSLANYQEALANLAQAEGTTLERRQVDVTLK